MKRTITIIVCFSVIILLLYGFFSLTLFETSAKYTDYKELNHFFESKELYISSSNLSHQENKYNIINYYNFADLELKISNSINDNQITNYDINYNLECNILDNQDKLYKCIIDNTENNIVSSILTSNKECIENNNLTEEECLEEKYNYNLVPSINNHKFKIVNNGGNKKLIEVELNLKTTSPYSKILKAKYILNIGNNSNNGIWVDEVRDYNSFCEYNIINNYHTNKNIKITIDSNKLIFDTSSDIYNNKIDYKTDENMRINAISFALINNQNIKLYKKDFMHQCKMSDINYIIIE